MSGADAFVTIVAQSAGKSVRDVFGGQGAQVTRAEFDERIGDYAWKRIETKKANGSTSVYVAGFLMQHRGHTYFGYAAAADATKARAAADEALASAAPSKSITGYGFSGKKYYFGFGEYLRGFMGNETRFDVAHTHDIFTSGAGGTYEGRRLVDQDFGSRDIKDSWTDIGRVIKPEDMYVQYSSGHGFERGLAVGVSYDEIRDNALAYGARETVIFIMACHSGGLVDSFNQRRAEWSGFKDEGKSLFVLASSRTSQTSSTGPGHDEDEPNGANGSAGSAFGHALWKALAGRADGSVDGVKDGFVSLGEITAYTQRRTRELGGHDPVVTGSYLPQTIVTRADVAVTTD